MSHLSQCLVMQSWAAYGRPAPACNCLDIIDRHRARMYELTGPAFDEAKEKLDVMQAAKGGES